MPKVEFGDIRTVTQDLVSFRHGDDGTVAVTTSINRCNLFRMLLKNMPSHGAFDAIGASEDGALGGCAVLK
jgi:hypothetical protein